MRLSVNQPSPLKKYKVLQDFFQFIYFHYISLSDCFKELRLFNLKNESYTELQLNILLSSLPHLKTGFKVSLKINTNWRFILYLNEAKTFLQNNRYIQTYKQGEMSIEAYRVLGETYKLHTSENSEIKFRYLMLGLKCKCKDAIEPALKMAAIEQGRMKFTRPLFRFD